LSFRKEGGTSLGNKSFNDLAENLTVPKGLAMLIRSENVGVSGSAAVAARPDAIPAASLSAASLPTLLLGGILLLIGP
jgi:hypothetical protein